MLFSAVKQKILKYFIIISISLTLLQGPTAGQEVSKMLDCITGARDEEIKENDNEGTEAGETLEKT